MKPSKLGKAAGPDVLAAGAGIIKLKEGKKQKKRSLENGATEKKRKRDATSDGVDPLANGAAPDKLSEGARKEMKRKKKEARKLKAALLAGGIEHVTSDPAVPSVTLANDGQKKPKKKKKKTSAFLGEGPTASVAAAAGGGAEDVLTEIKQAKKKKKLASLGEGPASAAGGGGEEALTEIKQARKKPKTDVATVASREGLMAAVGDREAAKRGPPVKKQLYKEAADVAAWPDAEVAAWRTARSMVLEGVDIKPVTRFDQGGFTPEMLQITRTFAQPSPIQAQCWPIVMSGRDLVGIAATGSGKTLAFGLPALRHLLAQRQGGPNSGHVLGCLVVAPTRELACQIEEVLREAAAPCGLRTLTVYGGVPKKDQARELRRGVDIVVATPGRLKDLLEDGCCTLSNVTFLVLDEADRMLDLGFEPDIRALASRTRADRQTVMFSATWPSAIRRLASEFMADPARVTIGSEDISASHSVTQVVEVIDPAARDGRLVQLMKKYQGGKKERVLVFVLYKKEAPRVEALLVRAGFKAAAVHGDISQGQRTQAVEGFKDGSVPVLVATDVAARGLDIPDVAAVINYSFPLTIEDYVHRIGRTGRAGKTGVAHTFFSGQTDKPRAGELMNVLREAGQEVPADLLRFGSTVKKKESKLYGAHFKDVDTTRKAVKVTFDSDDD